MTCDLKLLMYFGQNPHLRPHATGFGPLFVHEAGLRLDPRAVSASLTISEPWENCRHEVLKLPYEQVEECVPVPGVLVADNRTAVARAGRGEYVGTCSSARECFT